MKVWNLWIFVLIFPVLVKSANHENNDGNTRIDNNGDTTDENNGGNKGNNNNVDIPNNNNVGDTRNDNNNIIDTTDDSDNSTIDDLFPIGDDDVISVDIVDGNVIIDDVFGNIIGTENNGLQTTTPAMNNGRQNPKQSDNQGMKEKKRKDDNKKVIHEKDSNKGRNKPNDVIIKKYNHQKSVRCLPGFFLKNRKCRTCPKGFYQPKPGKTFCRRCPKGKTTRMEGTRDLCQCFDPRKKFKGCVKKCRGFPPGDYPSCLGCHFYVSCIGGFYIIDGRRCPAYLEWDDNCKRCEYKSNTCHHYKKKYSKNYQKSQKPGYS